MEPRVGVLVLDPWGLDEPVLLPTEAELVMLPRDPEGVRPPWDPEPALVLEVPDTFLWAGLWVLVFVLLRGLDIADGEIGRTCS